MNREAADIVGVWSLESFHEIDEAGRTGEGPLGAEPEGFLIYTPDGHVSVNMMRTGPGATSGSGAAFMGYAGTWRLDGGRLRHRIRVSSRADWVGADQERDAELEDGRLVVHSASAADSDSRSRVLVWSRTPLPN